VRVLHCALQSCHLKVNIDSPIFELAPNGNASLCSIHKEFHPLLVHASALQARAHGVERRQQAFSLLLHRDILWMGGICGVSMIQARNAKKTLHLASYLVEAEHLEPSYNEWPPVSAPRAACHV
jgi:hypothetical protein